MSNELAAASNTLSATDLADKDLQSKPQVAFKKPRSTVAGIIFSMMMPYPTVPGMVLTTAVQGIMPPSVKTSIKRSTKEGALLPVTIDIKLRNPLLPEQNQINQQRDDKTPERIPNTPPSAYALPGNGRRMRAWQTARDEQPVAYIPKPDNRTVKFVDLLKLRDDTKDSSGKGIV